MSTRDWQIAVGPRGRPFAADFIRHGVGLIRPGDTGAWKEAARTPISAAAVTDGVRYNCTPSKRTASGRPMRF
jgi:hypothetical protein